MSKGQKLKRQMAKAASKEGVAAAGDQSSGTESEAAPPVKNRDIIAKTGFYFSSSSSPSKEPSSPPQRKKVTLMTKNTRKPRPATVLNVESFGESDYYYADNRTRGFFYEFGGTRGWLRYPPEMRRDPVATLLELVAPVFPSPIPEPTPPVLPPASATSLESLEDSSCLSSPSGIGSSLSLNTSTDSSNSEFGWNYLVYQTARESSPNSSILSPIELDWEADWSKPVAGEFSSTEETTLVEQIKQISILWN